MYMYVEEDRSVVEYCNDVVNSYGRQKGHLDRELYST